MTRTAFSLMVFAGLLSYAGLLTACDPTKPTTGESVPAETADSEPCAGGDEDGDGFCPSDGDCDDENSLVNPAADEECDGIDNDCDDSIDEDVTGTYYADVDGDGFGDNDSPSELCEAMEGYVAVGDDCDDGNVSIYPGAEELCNGEDDDCDGIVDNDIDSTRYYVDADGDTYGDPDAYIEGCEDPGPGYVTNGDDCNDSEPAAYTGATEVCDGIDNDCNGTVDDGLDSTWYQDADGDSYGDDDSATTSCESPGREWIADGGDCDDADAAVNPASAEICNDIDDDCDGDIDSDALDMTEVVVDADGDGWGSPTATEWSCDAGADNTDDCDDSNAAEPVVVATTGTPGGAGTSADPLDTIQGGMDQATMCVFVEAGNYGENIDFGGENILVWGVEGSANTTITGTGSGSVVVFENGETSGAELNGFGITGGGGDLEVRSETSECGSAASCVTTWYNYYGGGILIDGAAPTLEDLHIWGNELPDYSMTDGEYDDTYVASYGGGIFVNNTLTGGVNAGNIVLEENSAYHGGGLYIGGAGEVTAWYSRFLWNWAYDGGGYASAGTLGLSNSILAANWATDGGGGGWDDGSATTIWNVSSVANDAAWGGGFGITGGGWLGYYSSTVTDATVGDGFNVESGSSLDTEYSNVYNNAGGDYTGASADSTDISADPMFTSWTNDGTDNDDLTLQAGSALVNAGNPSSAYNDADGSANDIGAYGGPGSAWN